MTKSRFGATYCHGRTSLQAPPAGALFVLALTRKLIGRHPECMRLINASPTSNTGKPGAAAGSDRPPGDASSAPRTDRAVDEFDATAETTADANALHTSLWELAALQTHYHPTVATLVRTTAFVAKMLLVSASHCARSLSSMCLCRYSPSDQPGRHLVVPVENRGVRRTLPHPRCVDNPDRYNTKTDY